MDQQANACAYRSLLSLSVSHRSRAGLSEGLGPPPLPSVVVVASYFLQHINLLLWIVTLSPLCE